MSYALAYAHAHAYALALAKAHGLKRLFLHAQRLEFRLGGRRYRFEAPLNGELSAVCDSFGTKSLG